jgi:ABC-type xylose transport system permease subunit
MPWGCWPRFVGGTPTWGGIGKLASGAIGAVTVAFIQTGVVARV